MTIRQVEPTMSDAKDPLPAGLYLLYHLDAIRDTRRHRFLAQDVVTLLREFRNQWCVEVILIVCRSACSVYVDINNKKMAYQDADEYGIGDLPFR